MYTILPFMASLQSLHMWIAIFAFVFVIAVLVFEWIDKTVAVIFSVLILVITGTITGQEVISYIDFTTITLLLALMLLVSIIQESSVLTWLNLQTIKLTKGNPLLLYIAFGLITLVLSTFLANATTMLILVPLTISLTKGMGLNAKPYIIFEMLFANVGGTLTVIGDASNIMISTANHLLFFEFMKVMITPIIAITVSYIVFSVWYNWKYVKPIHRSLTKLFITNMLIGKMEHQFNNCYFNKKFAINAVVILLITIVSMMLNIGGIPIEFIALSGAIVLLIISRKNIHTEKIFTSIDVHTLLFFAGLFILVGALDKSGALQYVSTFIITHATTALGVSLLSLWIVGMLSAFIENIPLVAMMIPVLQTAIASGTITGNTSVIWYALSLGACLGGNGSLVGSSASLIGSQIAAKHGVKISYKEHFAIGYPLTILALSICSIYIYFIS